VTSPVPGPAAAGLSTVPRPGSVAVVIPAKDESERIEATVTTARAIEGVDLVVVVDDGSSDGTARLAREAGAEVVRHERNRGKAAAMTSGADYVSRHEAGAVAPRALLFVDADLGGSAAATAALVPPVLSGEADMTIAVLPPQESPGGGHGFVVGLATRGVVRATSWTPTQPLSGMRCLSRPAFEAARPLARGWGVEVGLTVDLLRAGLRVLEVPCELHHRVTGRDLRAQLHRGRQYRDVWLALAVRRLRGRRWLRRALRRAAVADGSG
jgi:glycosyltransferase involved in cell wall biosynthesis